AVKTLSQFVADASHEFRTPLAVIGTTAQLALRRARESEAYRDSLQQIASEVERMTQLVEDLLILARGDTGMAEMPLAPIDLRDSFRRFYRANRARSGGGYGLGLSLAESIARAHGARIEVRSVEGSSSVFRVIFAAREARLDVINATTRTGTASPAA